MQFVLRTFAQQKGFKSFKFLLQIFKVVPSIIPFTFGEETLNFDESVTATCSISKGDLPIKIWWQFQEDGASDGFNLTTNDGILVTRTTQKVSMLAIDALKARHRGNYTCYASNKGGVASHSGYLAINGSDK